MSELAGPPRKKLPKELALIHADRCTGCAACIEVCPVDCITKIDPEPWAVCPQSFCEIDWDRCIGCKLCIRIPGKRSDPYELRVCPWEAIIMVPTAELPDAVRSLGGPPEYAATNRPRLEEVAHRQAELARRAFA